MGILNSRHAAQRPHFPVLTMIDAAKIIDTLQGLDPLADLPRTGYVIRGVKNPESIAAHSYAVAVAAMLLVDHLRQEGEEVDGELVLRLALLHDTPEAVTGDIPMPSKDGPLHDALSNLEKNIAQKLLPRQWIGTWDQFENSDSLEARIVRAADKMQMMVKVLTLEQQKQGNLDDFWANLSNYRDSDLPVVQQVYAEICTRAGRKLP
ncbi:MAG TPA: HD family hydrolase [Phycisphaeraceae bacterium]|nr:HD family hydrolase [Phycisphaeraceae bacterium]